MWMSVDKHILFPSKGSNSNFLSIVLIMNQIRFSEVLLMAMLALTWSGYTSLLPYEYVINNDRHSPVCMTG